MRRLNITAKIWLSVGVFILGYVLSTPGQIQSRAGPHVAADHLRGPLPSGPAQPGRRKRLPAHGEGFRRRRHHAGRFAALTVPPRTASRPWPPSKLSPPSRASPPNAPQTPANSPPAIDQMLADARTTYGAVMGGALTSATQDQMRALASRTDEAKAALAKTKEQLAGDLKQQLNVLEESSGTPELRSLSRCFVITLVVAGAIVHLTIRRPSPDRWSRVIWRRAGRQQRGGASLRANGAIRQWKSPLTPRSRPPASKRPPPRWRRSSATTRQNADRAGEADRLMQAARQTVERAARAMNDLTSSMNLISKSSHQVAGVLKNIDEIAFHTNILALNAAVEAARAGKRERASVWLPTKCAPGAPRGGGGAQQRSIIEQTVSDVAKGVEFVNHAHAAFQEVSATHSKWDPTREPDRLQSATSRRWASATSARPSPDRIPDPAQCHHCATNCRRSLGDDVSGRTHPQYLDELVSVVGLRNA